MNALELALWHLTGALRNAQLHRRAFCHAKRYPHRGSWVDGTKWPDLDPEHGCAKCHRTLRRVSYAYTLAVVLCRLERVRLKALTFDQRYARGELHAAWQTAEPGAILADLEASVDALAARPAFRMSSEVRGRLTVVHPALQQTPTLEIFRRAERQGRPDGRQALTPESPDTV